MPASIPALHLHPPGPDLPLVAVLAGAALGGGVLLGLALLSFRQRRSRSYLLIALAVGALFARTVVAALTMLDLLAVSQHHLLEHTLDVAMIAFVIGAVYYARTVERPAEPDERR